MKSRNHFRVLSRKYERRGFPCFATTQLLSDSSDVTTVTIHCDIIGNVTLSLLSDSSPHNVVILFSLVELIGVIVISKDNYFH